MPTHHPSHGIRCRILHITDNEADDQLLREVVSDYPDVSVTHAVTGESALDILGHPPSGDAQMNIVFLSWFLPMMTGEDVLKIIKSDGRLIPIPVIVFTSIRDSDEIRRIYTLGANCVITKSFNPTDLSTIETFVAFWGRVATLPFTAPLLKATDPLGCTPLFPAKSDLRPCMVTSV
jgi:CheY-like chemotaxis protein